MSVCRAAHARSKNESRATNCKLCGKKLAWHIGRTKWCVLWQQCERGTRRIQVRNVTAGCRWLSRSHRRLPSRSSGMFLSRLLSRLPSRLPSRSSGRFLTSFFSRLLSSLLSSLSSKLLCRLPSCCSVDCLIGRPVGFSVGCLLGHLPFRLLSCSPSTLLSSIPEFSASII